MPELKSRYKTKAEIPAGYEGLYVEQYDAYHITGIEELDALRRELHELKKQVATDEYATRARIQAAVERVNREHRAPSLRQIMVLADKAIRRLLSRAPFGDDYHNPWSREGWNITEQGRYFRQYGDTTAGQAAKSVGSHIGATRPPEQLAA